MRLFRRDTDFGGRGRRGTAIIHNRQWASTSDDDFMRFAPHLIELEVRVDGREPYRVRATFDVPRKFWNIARGLELPVIVDPDRQDRVNIDWAAFAAAGGVEIVARLGDQYRRDAVRDIVSKDPVQRAAALAAVEEWLAAVRAGQMSVPDFNGFIDGYATDGHLTTAEAEAAKERASEPPAAPTNEAYPPVEGVDYATWIAAVVGIIRQKVSQSQVNAYYESCSFPAGRGEAISAVWYQRVQSDEELRAAFMRDTAR